YLREGDRVTGVRVRDAETGRETDVRARVVLNAAGVWTDHLQQMLGEEGGFTVRASKGVHIVVDRDKVDSEAALILRTEKSVLFVIPWGEYWIIGTTDTDWQLDLAHPAATGADIDYILGHVNAVLTTPIVREDVRGVYAGLRPLLSGGADSTAKLSREHAVMTVAPGAVVVAGGKYTTYRVMAADAVDAAVAEMGEERAGSVPASTTDRIPLLGADGYPAMVNRADRIADNYEIRELQVQHLLDRYGSLLEDVLDLAAGRPDLLETLGGAERYLRVEVVYAALAEAALHLEDVLVRRTRISMEYQHGGVACAREVAAL
ncbi:MAG: glycerol-3-phosphate dehydrogenase/oxidase, partial [Dietzia cercidiphylli]